MRYTLTNAGPKPITVDLVQSGLWGDTRISDQSIRSERLSADDVRWRVPVPANGETTVTATFDSRLAQLLIQLAPWLVDRALRRPEVP